MANRIVFTVEDDGTIFRKTIREIIDGDEVVATRNHIDTFTPNQPFSDLPDNVKPYAQLKWTTNIIDAYNAKLSAQEAANA